MKTSTLRPILFSVLAIATAAVSARASTVALWLFDEQEGIYPSSLLNDAGPNSYFLALGRGGEIVPGKFGRALKPVAPAPLEMTVAPGGSPESRIRFGLMAPAKKPGRTVDPLTWENANFAAMFTDGEQHLRRAPFANATDSKLNLGASAWTVEFWFQPDAKMTEPGVVYEVGAGPRGENNLVTSLVYQPRAAAFVWRNAPANLSLTLRAKSAIKSGEWVHCAFVHDSVASEIRFYLNGELQSRTPAARWAALAHGDESYVSIARDGLWQNPLPGAIDELHISDEALYGKDFAKPGSLSRIHGGNYQPASVKAGPPLLFPGNRAPAGVIDLGSRRHVFLDDVLIEKRNNITLEAHSARIAERVVKEGGGWISVVEGEDGVIRLYTTGPQDMPLVYTSKDGINFEAPALDLVANKKFPNILMREPATVGCTIVDPNAPPSERYKIITGLRKWGGLFVYTSADGYHFVRNETAALPFWTGSATIAFWDDQRQVYVVHNRTDYYRGAGGDATSDDIEGGTVRKQVLTETTDLMRPWPFKPVTQTMTREFAKTHEIANTELDPWWLDNGPLAPGGFGLEYPIAFEADPNIDPIGTDVYNTRAIKYEWAPDAYLAFPLMYYHYHQAGPVERQILGHPDEKRGSGNVEAQIAVSRDGLNWIRYPRPAYLRIGDVDGYPIIRPYIGQGMVRRGNEIWQYCYSLPSYHSPWAKEPVPTTIHRVVQRVDGFVSLDAPYVGGGTFTTKSFRFTGNRLVLNIDTGAAGDAQVGFVDENGKPIPGFSVDECVYINGNDVDYPVKWIKQGADVSSLAGRTVRLVVRMRGASLYALQFTEAATK